MRFSNASNQHQQHLVAPRIVYSSITASQLALKSPHAMMCVPHFFTAVNPGSCIQTSFQSRQSFPHHVSARSPRHSLVAQSTSQSTSNYTTAAASYGGLVTLSHYHPIGFPLRRLQCGRCSTGCQKKRFSVQIKSALNEFQIPPNQLEVLAEYSDVWCCATCNHGN